VKVADSLLDFANWLGRPYGYDSHEDINKYGVCVPLLDLGLPELVLYGTSTKARVPHSSYPEPQSYPGYSKPWRDKESAPLVEIPVSEGPPGSEAVREGDSDADEEEEESVEEGHKLPNRTTCLNIDPVVMFIEYKFYQIKTKISMCAIDALHYVCNWLKLLSRTSSSQAGLVTGLAQPISANGGSA
jgi:hypothetical protein